MVHMVSSWRLHRVKVEDGRVDAMGCIGPFYPKFAIFFIRSQRHFSLFVFCFGL
jgi:hypothetical protein